jgi:hypothetical protein
MAATTITINGRKVKGAAKGERMTGKSGWRMIPSKGKIRVFKGTLLKTVNSGNTRIAIFSVPK